MIEFALFFGCPVRGEKKGELNKRYNGRFSAIIPQFLQGIQPLRK